MAKKKDWIPRTVPGFDKFQGIFCLGVHTNVVAWKITATKDAALQALNVIYVAFYLITKNKATATADDFLNTKVARKNLKAAIRTLTAQEIKNNTNMTDINRKDIGVPNAPAAKEKAPVSLVAPSVSYKSVSSLIGFYKFTPKAKPDGQDSYQIKTGFYVLTVPPGLPTPIPTEKQCTQTDIIGKASDPIEYDVENKGMQFVSYIRYRNTDKKLGKAVTIYYGTVS
jgi:hypothetical protein